MLEVTASAVKILDGHPMNYQRLILAQIYTGEGNEHDDTRNLSQISKEELMFLKNSGMDRNDEAETLLP
jgi:hypothetical protein